MQVLPLLTEYNHCEKSLVPLWFEGLDEEPFVRGIEFMLKENIVRTTTKVKSKKEKVIVPQWLKYNVGWVQEKIPDETLVKGIEFLIK